MPGRLRLPLQFSSDSALEVDFALTSAGAAVDLTSAQIRLNFALRRAEGGFVLEVGSGIETPGSDGLVHARVASADMAARIGDYDLSLQVQLPAGDWVTWLTGRAEVAQGAYARAEGASALNTGEAGSNALTIAVDWSDAIITVDATPGVQGPPSTQDLLIDWTGTLDSSELIKVAGFGRPFSFSPGASVAYLATLPTSAFTVSILKNNEAWAVASWSAGQHLGVIACSAPNIAAGDVIAAYAPNPADATAADGSIYLVSAP